MVSNRIRSSQNSELPIGKGPSNQARRQRPSLNAKQVQIIPEEDAKSPQQPLQSAQKFGHFVQNLLYSGTNQPAAALSGGVLTQPMI